MQNKFDKVMLKLETTSLRYDAGIVCISAVKFSFDHDETEDMTIYINPLMLRGTGVDLNVDTLKYLREKRNYVWTSCRASRNGLSDGLGVLVDFLSDLDGNEYHIWCNATDLVIPVLNSNFRLAGIKVPWSFYNVCDLRTVVTLANFDSSEFLSEFSNPLDICIQQVSMLKTILQK